MTGRGAHRPMARRGPNAKCDGLLASGAVRVLAVAAASAVWFALACAAPRSAHASDALAGADLYRRHCAACHGGDGRPVLPAAPDLTRPTALFKPDLALLASIRGGRGAMPAYAGQLRDREILDIVAHLRTLR